ncbi:MAG: HlyD family efflux transporter periplasmic adaptor subunit [Hormoscilla sp. GM7CHS1pb]|nr:HlyD family efflux transporter periplasmic adaptor subunit [Hormoscilla sp. GM7CHS1pb]
MKAENIEVKKRDKEIFVEQPVILERSIIWSQVLVWLLLGVTSFAVVWAAVAKIDEAVPAMGKLEPEGSVSEVKAPTTGVVEAVYVEDGEYVKEGDLLVTFEEDAPEADIESLTKLRETLIEESKFYKDQVNGTQGGPPELVALVRLKNALQEENVFLTAEIGGYDPEAKISGEFNANQRLLLTASRNEYRSRVEAARLQVRELEKQLSQTEDRLAATGESLTKAQQILALNQATLERLEPLVEEGAVAQLQYDQQKQRVLGQEDQVLSRQAEIQQLILEIQRLKVAISQAQEQMQNTRDISAKDVLTRIAENQKRIAEIDTQLSRAKLENQKRLTEIDGELVKARQALRYREVRSPKDGVVFDLQVGPQSVAQATDIIVKIVPNDELLAKVYLQNKDVGFVKEGMEVEVDVSSFPSSEFGTIPGKLVWVGSDALEPTQIRPYYSFPAKIEMSRQHFNVGEPPNQAQLRLQSGMEVNTRIKVRKRTVMNLLLDKFDTKVRSLETVR